MNNFNDSLAPYLHKQESIQFCFTKARAQQTACFQTIAKKLTTLEDSISFLENSIAHLQPKLKVYSDLGDSHKMNELRQKQRQFIIKQLEDKIKRLILNEQSTQTQLTQKQSMVFQLQFKCQQLQTENTELKQQISKKNKQIKQLTKNCANLKLQKSLEGLKSKTEKNTINLSQVSIKKEENDLRNQNYQQIQTKLKDMQDCLNQQIQQYKRKNILLQQQSKQLKQQLKQQSSNVKRIYQLQLKVKNLMSQNKELQQSYTSQLAANNENEVKFHKKINELKGQILQIKKSNKNISKQVDRQLRKLSATVLGPNDKPTIFIGATTISDQFSQLAKQIVKCNKKEINQINFQKQTIIEDLKLVVETNKYKILELTQNLEKSKVAKSQKEKVDKPILTNGSSTNRSNASKNEIQIKQKYHIQKIQQKYQQNINILKNQLNAKQRSIEEMRKKFDEEQTNLVKKTLDLTSKLAQKQMQIKYLQQKCNNLENINADMEKKIKEQKQKQEIIVKQKIKDLEKQRDQLKIKIKQIQDKLINKEKQLKQAQRKQKQGLEKIKKYEQKNQSKSKQYQNLIKGKDGKIEELISRNQQLNIQVKLLQQKNKILETKQVKNIQQPQTPTFNPIMQLKKQMMAQKQQLFVEIRQKNNQINALKIQNQQQLQSQKKKEQKITEFSNQLSKYQNDNKLLQSQIEILKQTIQKLKTNKVEQQNSNFSQLKQQYEKREKLLKQQTQKMSSEAISMKKQLEQQNRRLREELKILKQQHINTKQLITSMEEQKLKFDAQRFKDSERQRKTIKNYEQKIKELSSSIQNLNRSLNQQQVPSKQIKSIDKSKVHSFKGTDSIQYVDFGVSTQKKVTKEEGMNTVDLFAMETQNKGMSNILDFNDADSDPNKSHGKQALRNSNLFLNLNDNNQHIAQNVDVFEICDENQQVNIGQSSIAFQLRQIFTNLRIQIQKLFNEQEISLVVAKMLPQATQDDFYELMSYIKQKISEIKENNELSFIRAEPGNQPQLLQDSIQFPQLTRGGSEGQIILRKTIQQKDALIHSLMNQKTEQQNTINQLTMQKQEKEEENQNRFMNQCNVYKKQIKQHKKHIDLLEMNFQSMKNVIRNVLEAYSTDEDMEDDFRQSMTMYAKVAKLSEKQRSRINFYIQKYVQIKGIQDAS